MILRAIIMFFAGKLFCHPAKALSDFEGFV